MSSYEAPITYEKSFAFANSFVKAQPKKDAPMLRARKFSRAQVTAACRITNLFHGEVVELGDADSAYSNPKHSYARRLIRSVPSGPGFDIGERRAAVA